MVMPAPEPLWIVDPNRPRAPPEEIWDRMSPEERRRVVDALPSEFEIAGALPPEGDLHLDAKIDARDVLSRHFGRVNRPVKLGSELAVYYPGEDVIAPDLMVVLDVSVHERERWAVQEEGKGVDFAMDIIVEESRLEEVERNVERYARLGIPEYFVFDRGRLKLWGYRLPPAGPRAYQPIVPLAETYTSDVLGLDLRVEGSRLRFYHAATPLLDSKEVIASLQERLRNAQERLARLNEATEGKPRLHETRHLHEEEARRAREAARREEEARLRAEAERKLAEMVAEVERLKAERRER